ncbi:guanine nucleotide exchange protein smcr8b-like [Sardina pilchardus]|uniref:guanine nucleotide exchange protein smcr8b-like n=1 Tax=Sardina pilchardus TaxID=27697 RepID=UPI002E165E37
MIGSSDILALARGHEQTDSRTQQTSKLPDHLSLPPLPRPWHPGPAHHSDSVLLCEFRTGPGPAVDRPEIRTGLQTEIGSGGIRIVSKTGIGTGLEPRLLFITPEPCPDVDLVLRLLTGGYQATRGGGSYQAMRDGDRDQSDSWMLLGDGRSGVFVYAHYVPLVDQRARVAIALVSHDSLKLVRELQELNKAFSQVSHTLHTTHTLKTKHIHTLTHTETTTVNDPDKHLHTHSHTHLETTGVNNAHTHLHTESHTQIDTNQSGREEEREIREEEVEREGVERWRDEENKRRKEEMNRHKDESKRERKEERREDEEESNSSTHPEGAGLAEMGVGPGPMAESCDWFLSQQTVDSLCAIQVRFCGDASLLVHQRECASLLSRLSTTNFLFEDPPPPQQHTSPSNPLHGNAADISCVEAVPIKLEAEPEDRVNQSRGSPSAHVTTRPTWEEDDGVSMETGSHSSGDSIEVLATERSLRDDPVAMERSLRDDSVAVECSLRDDPVAMETSWNPSVQQPIALVSRWGAQRTDSQDSSIEVLSRDHSFLWEDFRPADTLPHSLMGTVVQEEEEEEGDWQGDVGTVVQEEEDLTGTVGFFQNNAEQQRFMGPVVQDNAEQQRFMATVVQECQFSLCTPTNPDLHHHDNMFQEACPLVGLLPLCPNGQKDRDAALLSCASWRYGHDKGQAALRLVRNWGHAHQALFSLLTGRPLVVLGNDEERVRDLVLALELFLPNTHADTYTHTHADTHTPRVLPWCCRPIQITDLLEFGIIGLNRRFCQSSPSMPLCLERYARYLSILDADHMTLQCPAYHGTLIGPLTKPQSQLREGRTYALLVQSSLTRLAARAFHRVFTGHEAELSPGATDDIRILEYLCDIIKLRHTHHAPSSVLRFSYQPCTHFR